MNEWFNLSTYCLYRVVNEEAVNIYRQYILPEMDRLTFIYHYAQMTTVAISRGWVFVVKYLFEKEKKPMLTWYPIQLAAENGHLEMVKYLIKSKISIATLPYIFHAKTEEIKEYLKKQRSKLFK